MSNEGPIDLTLLPSSARVADDGSLSVGGVDLAGLATELGTPLYVYDETELRNRCRQYRASFGAGVAYASKAFLCTAMAKLVAEEGLDLDVATGGELHVARRAGFPAACIVLHGNNKSSEELRTAIEAGVGRIVVDSFDELDRLDEVAPRADEPIAVLVRVTPGVEAHTHEYIETGTDDSKFGFSLQSGDALRAAVRVHGSDTLRLAGLHCHIGSQVFRLDSYAAAIDRMVALVLAVENETGAPVDELSVGGGLGIAYTSEDEPPSVDDYVEALLKNAPEGVTVLCEPGRSLVGNAGVTAYTVGTVKEIPGVRTYVAVDGGMSDNLRPVTYGAQYEAFLPARASAPRPKVVTVAGKHCEQGDVLVRDAHLPADVRVGDVLATPVTGAYAHSMASNYNKVARPAVVFVRDGSARVVVRREDFDDLVRLDT